jgi:hypothetical protein
MYRLGRLDASGRITDRAIGRVLGWQAGDRLTVTASPAMILARRDHDGMVVLPARASAVIPARARRRCQLCPGDRVLLATVPGQDALAIYPLSAVDRALQAHCPRPPGTTGKQP